MIFYMPRPNFVARFFGAIKRDMNSLPAPHCQRHFGDHLAFKEIG